MSGIAAIFDGGGAPVSADELLRLLQAIAHRGPHEGMWLRQSVALGQRLLPTTPEATAEGLPIRVAGGHYQLALDGRIDNREDLGAKLGIDLVHTLVTDADLIVHAYDRWGVDCLKRLIGDFAFVLWDQRQASMFAARDQRGFRPLVYARLGRRLILGSEPQQVLTHPGLAHAVDPLFLACHLSGAVPPPGATPYQGVSEVPPAHYLLTEGNDVSIREYWRFGPRPALPYRGRREYVEHFEATFEKAVAGALRARSGAAVLLSGGLDSSYVLARAAALDPNIRAFTAFAAGTPGMDERAHSRAVVERLRVPVREVPVDDCWSLSSRYLPDAAFDQPALPVQAPLMARLAEAAHQDGVDVLIDGMGGDEFMAGPSDYPASLLVSGRFRRAAEEARAWSRDSGLPLALILARSALVPLLPRVLRNGYRALRGRSLLGPLPCWIDCSALRALGLERALALPPHLSRWGRTGALERFWAIHLRDALPALTWRERRASLPLGVETRSPFWDLRVLELMLRIPPWVHRKAGQPKALLREAMQSRLPQEILNRNDKGTFDELMRVGLLEHERERVEAALLSGPLTSLPYIKRPALEAELGDYRSHGHPWWHALWRAVTAGLWLRPTKVSRGHRTDRLVEV